MYAKSIAVAVTVKDPRHPDKGKTVAMTVHNQDPDVVVRAINEFCRRKWDATDINDKRHKRR